MIRKSPHPDIFRQPIDCTARVRMYAPEFSDHERAVAFIIGATAEHRARYGSVAHSRHVNGFWDEEEARRCGWMTDNEFDILRCGNMGFWRPRP